MSRFSAAVPLDAAGLARAARLVGAEQRQHAGAGGRWDRGVIRVESLIKQATGRGLVFDPNPVVALQDESLTDQQDANSAVPAAAYRQVLLRHLDGSGYLRGSYAEIVLAADELAFSPTNSFRYGRSNDYFEQVEAYHAVDVAQTSFQGLGIL